MLFVVNSLLKFNFISENTIKRILWVDEDCIFAVLIDINDSKALPEFIKTVELEEELLENNIEFYESDPFAYLYTEEEISPVFIEKRNIAWSIISEIVNKEPEIYYRDTRGELVREIIKNHNVTKATVYKYLRKYWQRGMTVNALLPDYDRCGAAGLERSATSKKRGRPRKWKDYVGEGINVDEETKKIFRIAVKEFYMNRKEITLKKTYELMLKKFYTEEIKRNDGAKIPALDDERAVPTLVQFRYWFQKEFSPQETTASRKGRVNYALEHRAVLGRSDSGFLLGPGSIYQIDATVGDVYLVSRYDREDIIGRPVIYAVIDVFSRMVTGIYIGLEGPSWTGAMMALANAASDKVKFCKEYGIEITEDEWPCHFVPDSILADRGELAGRMPETFIKNLHVRVENLPPYRADWKGIVEQHFRVTHELTTPFLPGAVKKKSKEIRERDYRLDAELDIFEFTRIIIKCVLYHNNYHYLNNYEKDSDLIADNVIPIPRELWKWGIKNRAGRLRAFPEDIIRLNLMPADTATVTHRGIKFKNMYYSCETAMQERWFDKARLKNSWKVNISYDPRCLNYIYLRSEDGRSYENCFLLDPKGRFTDKSLDEIDYVLEKEKMAKEKYRSAENQARLELDTEIENIVRKSKKSKEKDKQYLSKSQKLKGIREKRKKEKEKLREEESWVLGEQEDGVQGKSEQVSPAATKEDRSEHYNLKELLNWRRKKEEERVKGEENGDS